jgi:hypothetical protein
MAKEQKTTRAPKTAPAPAPAVAVEHNEEAPKVEGLAAPAAVAAPATARPAAESPKDKILIFGNDNGAIDLDSMRGRTREKFVSWVRKTPELFPPQITTQPLAAAIPDEAISVLFNLVGIGETILASKKFPPQIAAAAFMWNRKEIEAIKEPAKALAAKYLPAMGAWKEEVAFVSVFVDIHFAKMSVLRQLMAEHSVALQAANKTPGPKPGDSAGTGMPGEVSPSDPAPAEGKGKIQ